MDFKTFDASFACVDFFFCGMYYAQGDIKKAAIFGFLGFVLHLCAVLQH